MIFKLLFQLFLDVLFLLLRSLPVLAGAYLIGKRSGIIRFFGWLLLLVLVFYWFSWISPFYVIRGGERVQEFSLNGDQFGGSPFISWINNSPRLLLEPDPSYVFPEGERILSVDLEARRTQWLPKTAVNLDDAIPIKYLPDIYTEKRAELSLSYAFPSKAGQQSEFSFFGFSLPQLVYEIDFLSGNYGWRLPRKYFGWVRLAVRKSDSDPVVVELNQVTINASWEHISSSTTKWLPGGKFLIFKPFIGIDRRVLALGPFDTSQDIQSTHNSKE